jgi:phage gpG-like protein
MAKKITGIVSGLNETLANLKKFDQRMVDEAQKVYDDTAVRVQNVAVRSIHKGPKTGRSYGRHKASAPGEAPATDTGALASSIARVSGKPGAAVGTNLEYGKHLEFGTTNIKPRPWLFPALESQRKYFETRMADIGKRAAKGLTTKGAKR